MKPEGIYHHLSILLDYPVSKAATDDAAAALSTLLAELGCHGEFASFEKFVAASTLGELQEEYVRTFDFNPLCAPYISHHLYGDNIKKGSFMITLKELYRQHGFEPRGCELPDHLAVLLDCAAHLSRSGSTEARSTLINTFIFEGLEKMNSSAAGSDDLQWRHPIAAAFAVATADTQEANHA